MTDEAMDDLEPTPEEIAEEERKAVAVREMIREHVEAGWTWDSGTNMLTHPADREINMWIHPYSHEVLYSPELVAVLRQQVDREARGDTP